MRGHVGKRDGAKSRAWYYVLSDGHDPVTGKRRQYWRRGFATKKTAEDALSTALAERAETGAVFRPADDTLGAFMEAWLDTKAPDLRPTTLYAYRKLVNQRIVPSLGHVKLAQLDTATIESWYRQLRASGGRDGARLSAKTVANTAGVVTKALKDAVRWGKLRVNPAAGAELPKRDEPDTTAWSAEEATAFLRTVAGDRWAPMWRLALATGLRRGELLGLRWSDVDLVAGLVRVEETRVVAEREEVGPPKTKAGRRTVRLDSGTLATLKAWRKTVAADQLQAGEAWQDSARVFVDAMGRAPHPETVTRWWREACDRAGVRRIRLHDARHTAATLALRAGEPLKAVSQRLGHADVGVTMRVYQHVDARDDQQVADTLGGLLDGHA